MEKSIGCVKNVFVFITIVLVLYLWVSKGKPEPAQLTLYISADKRIAVLVCFAFFIFKCFCSFLPSSVIYAFCICTLPPWWAVIMGIAGSAMVFSVAFWEGRKEKSVLYKRKGGFINSLFLHCVKLIPCTVAARLLGKSGAAYFGSLIGAVIGATLPLIITLYIAGELTFVFTIL